MADFVGAVVVKHQAGLLRGCQRLELAYGRRRRHGATADVGPAKGSGLSCAQSVLLHQRAPGRPDWWRGVKSYCATVLAARPDVPAWKKRKDDFSAGAVGRAKFQTFSEI